METAWSSTSSSSPDTLRQFQVICLFHISGFTVLQFQSLCKSIQCAKFPIPSAPSSSFASVLTLPHTRTLYQQPFLTMAPYKSVWELALEMEIEPEEVATLPLSAIQGKADEALAHLYQKILPSVPPPKRPDYLEWCVLNIKTHQRLTGLLHQVEREKARLEKEKEKEEERNGRRRASDSESERPRKRVKVTHLPPRPLCKPLSSLRASSAPPGNPPSNSPSSPLLTESLIPDSTNGSSARSPSSDNPSSSTDSPPKAAFDQPQSSTTQAPASSRPITISVADAVSGNLTLLPPSIHQQFSDQVRRWETDWPNSRKGGSWSNKITPRKGTRSCISREKEGTKSSWGSDGEGRFACTICRRRGALCVTAEGEGMLSVLPFGSMGFSVDEQAETSS